MMSINVKGFEEYTMPHKPDKERPFGVGAIKREFTSCTAHRRLFFQDPLFWVIKELGVDRKYSTRWLNRGLLLGFLSDLLREPKNRKRLDSDMLEALKDLSDIWDLWLVLQLYRPSYERELSLIHI